MFRQVGNAQRYFGYFYSMRTLLATLCCCFALLTTAQDAHNVKLLCNWQDSVNVRINRLGQRYNDVWGFTWKSVEYAAVGSTEGVHIIDVNNCRQVAFYPGNERGEDLIHRDYKTYKNYLYTVADEGINSTLQVIDFSYLPDSVHLVYESTPLELALTHNIFIDTAKAKLYCASARGIQSGNDYMRVYSLAKPDSPKHLIDYNDFDVVHDVYVRNDTAYCSSSFKGYYIVDFTNPAFYTVIGGLPFYPYQGYNHSSWINEKNIGVMADETHGMPIKVIDVKKTTDIKVRGTFMPSPQDPNCIPHNPYLIGDYVFISYYYDGFQVYNISNPDSPYRTGYYDTYPQASAHSYAGAWGCYPYLPSGKVLVSDMQTGFYVFDADQATGKAPPDTTKPILAHYDFMIFPNPVRGNDVNITIPLSDSGKVHFNLFDISGRLVLSYDAGEIPFVSQPIQLTLPGNMPAGLYLLHTTAGTHTYAGKIIKL